MVGETIGSYRILGELGQGGMGTVYLAEHRHLLRKAAIKVLLKEFVSRPDLLERFFAEARATSLIEHPGIVQIFDCEVDGQGRTYIVMEYLGGETLAALLRRQGALPSGEAVAYARRLAEALAAAHDKGIIHRDIKPDNVFARPGPPPAVKLVDFGIAKLADEFHAGNGKGMRSRTQTGLVMGTPLYMSPEQCRGAGAVDYRTDIYSLGCLLFEMLSGRPPFQHEGAGELVAAHLTQPAPALESVAPGVSAEVCALVAAMLSKAPADRPQTMHDVADRLAACEPPEFAGPAWWPSTGATPRLPGNLRPGPIDPPAGPAGEPPAPPSITPPAQTTLRGSASEIAVADDDADLSIPRRRARPLLILSVAAATAAGAWLWFTRSPESPATAPPPTAANVSASPAASASSIPPAPASPAPSPPSHAPAPSTPPRPRPRLRPQPAASPATSPPAATVQIHLDSNPPGAQICLDSDRRLLGTAPHPLTLPRGGKATVLLQLPGYRLQRVLLRADRDVQRTVTMSPLGPDELAAVIACRR